MWNTLNLHLGLTLWLDIVISPGIEKAKRGLSKVTLEQVADIKAGILTSLSLKNFLLINKKTLEHDY
jgi:hypothetical protein